MHRKKILHFISGLEIGGTETQLLRILPKMQKYHDNRVCCFRGHGPIGIKLEKNNVPVYYLDFQGIFDLGIFKRFHSITKDFHPDILVTYLIHADLSGRILGKLFNIKKIVSSKRGSLLQWEWLSKIDCLTKWMINHYLVQTQVAKSQWMQKLSLSADKFTVIPNGIDTKLFQQNIDILQKKSELQIKPGLFVITCVSRLRRGKGHDILLAAFEKVYHTNPNIALLLVGDGEKEIGLRKQIKNYVSKDAIFFLGNRKDVPEILAISDLFILPTEGEGMSNAIIEAMSAGLPIITTDIPENQDLIIDKKTGILFPVNNANSLSEKIEALLADTEQGMAIGQSAQKAAEECFNDERVTLRLAEFYAEI